MGRPSGWSRTGTTLLPGPTGNGILTTVTFARFPSLVLYNEPILTVNKIIVLKNQIPANSHVRSLSLSVPSNPVASWPIVSENIEN